VLGAEEDKARALLDALSPAQLKICVVDREAYPDILTEHSRKAALAGQPSGLPASEMNAAQRQLLDVLLAEYVDNLPGELAEQRRGRIREAGGKIWFAWAGQTRKGGPHYYRIQSPTFLVEYDNTQDNANHIHTVWRDFEDDFGVDLLAEHYLTAPPDHGHDHPHGEANPPSK
jgi:hypothetical protein